MKNTVILLLLLSVLISCASEADKLIIDNSPDASKKVLFVCTSIDEVNGTKNGTFLSEIAVPFILFEEEGLSIDIVSPKGNSLPIYYKFDTTELISRALNSAYYTQQIDNSLKPNEVVPEDYNVVILPGGYGQFWDIHNNDDINNLIAKIYEDDGIIGALGHGTSSLVNVYLTNGDPLVKDKILTCFPSWFEKEVMFEADYGTLLPFDMEEELEKRQAKLKRVDKESRSNSQIIDKENRIITASSATGGEFVAQEVLKLLGH